MAVATTEPVRLPPRLRLPKLVQGIGFGPAKHQMFGALYRRWGTPFTVDAPMRQLSERVINTEVLRGMEKNSKHYLELIDHLPALLRSFGRLFAGVPGTLVHRELERGRNSYRIYRFTKD
jgi:hypothetical protein